MTEPAAPSKRPVIATVAIGCGIALAATFALLVCGSVGTIVALTVLGQSLDDTFSEIADDLEQPPPPT